MDLTHWTDAQLQDGWERVSGERVQSGPRAGRPKIAVLDEGYAVLKEAEARGLELSTPRKYL
jgi:hypothetical protein